MVSVPDEEPVWGVFNEPRRGTLEVVPWNPAGGAGLGALTSPVPAEEPRGPVRGRICRFCDPQCPLSFRAG